MASPLKAKSNLKAVEKMNFRDRSSLFDSAGARIPLFPAEVRGFWRKRRNLVQIILVLVFLLVPWIKIDGTPLLLIDVRQGQLFLFGLHFWRHDIPLVFFLGSFLILSLALMTAIAGRVWCGWACPQTVFIDGLFRRIERWTEGNHLQRREWGRAPWSYQKAIRKFSKWSLFLFASLVISHSLIAYFVGVDALHSMMLQNPNEHWTTFSFMALITAAVTFNFVWFREQFCMIMCPYGRFQSVLMDRDSVTVQYDSARGEPRKEKGKSATQSQGSCVDCRRCVAVCPTGIDIRDGIQLECISCTACIDACDEIMVKTKQPTGLIRYMSSSVEGPQLFRPRTLLYAVLLLMTLLGLGYNLLSRQSLDVSVLRALESPYYQKTDAEGKAWIVNTYRLHIRNQGPHATQVTVSWQEPMKIPEAHLDIPQELLNLRQFELRMIPFAIEIPVDALSSDKIALPLKVDGQKIEVQFVAPGQH